MSLTLLCDPPETLPTLHLFVPGKPQTAGSKSAFVNPKTGKAIVTESGSSKSKARKRTWRGDLRDAATQARDEAWSDPMPTRRALAVTFVFARARTTTEMRIGRHAGQLKDWAVGRRPVERPDALKLARAAEDALTGVLWVDDSQIVDERLVKAFGDDLRLDPRAEGVLIVVHEAGAYSGPLLPDPAASGRSAHGPESVQTPVPSCTRDNGGIQSVLYPIPSPCGGINAALDAG